MLDVHEKLFDVVAAADLVFWPIALDIKYKDVENMPDKHIDLTLFNGAVRNCENEHMAKLLRAEKQNPCRLRELCSYGRHPRISKFSTKEEFFAGFMRNVNQLSIRTISDHFLNLK